MDKIEYTDAQGQKQTLNCYFQNGPNYGKSKGLMHLAKDLEVKVPSKIKLEDLRTLLSDHPAFKTVTFYTPLNLLKLLMRLTVYRFLD